jgi:hypothetical protein
MTQPYDAMIRTLETQMRELEHTIFCDYRLI